MDVCRAGRGSYLDLFLELIGPDGGTLIMDDDSGGNLNPRIANFVLPQAGVYGVQASSLGGSTGSYELVIAAGVPPTPTPAPPTPGPSPTPFERTIELGQSVEGMVHPNSEGDRYIFWTDEPMVVEVVLHSGDWQSTLYLDMFDPNGVQQTLVDYNNPTAAILLPNVVLATPGEYIFRVLNYRGYAVDYVFSIAASETMMETGGPISYGQGVSGELLYPGQEDRWTFEGRAGDRVIIIMNGVDNLDSYLMLRNAAGRELARNDDAPGTLDARIDYVLPTTGQYTIVARSFGNNSFGQYRLQLFLSG